MKAFAKESIDMKILKACSKKSRTLSGKINRQRSKNWVYEQQTSIFY